MLNNLIGQNVTIIIRDWPLMHVKGLLDIWSKMENGFIVSADNVLLHFNQTEVLKVSGHTIWLRSV